MKRAFLALITLATLAVRGQAILQVDIDAGLFPEGHGPSASQFVLFGNPTVRQATLISGPDGWPLAYHLVFDYDDVIQGGAVSTVSVTGGTCTKTWTPVPFTTFYQQGPAFPVNWAFNGTVAPDNDPFALCTCWPDDPDCTPPVCAVSESTLDFGTAESEQAVVRDFTITNTGGGILAGTVTESCAAFSIVSGASYSLGAGQSQTVTVRFMSNTPGTHTCTLDTGGDCADVFCTGSVASDPVCALDPSSLDFGSTDLNVPVTRTFTVTNTGGGTLSGTVSETCAAYSILSGGDYSLGTGQSQTVTVQLLSSLAGSFPCTLTLGGDCGSVACTGIVEGPPACSIDPSVLDFGVVEQGVAATMTFTVTNSGGGTLAGTFLESCGEFTVISGADYSLGAGQSQVVTVQFQSDLPGNFACPVIGTTCPNSVLPCLAFVDSPTDCFIHPTTLDFGTTTVGTPVNRTFTITNFGEGMLSGTVTESCAGYQIVSGATLNLAQNQSQVVTLRLLADAPGSFTCTVNTTQNCDPVSCTGVVELAPACQLSTAALDFGVVELWSVGTRTFTVTNTGGGTLAGTVSSPHPDFTVTGGATYALTAGQSQLVTVQFVAEELGPFDTLLDTGSSCPDLPVSATVEPAPACQLSATTVDLGLLLPDEIANGSFTITNTGGGTLSGTVVADCEHFTLTAPAAYALTAGQSQTFTFDFFSPTPGQYSCPIATGACGTVTATAAVEPAPVCQVSTASLDFGSVLPDTPHDLGFTITNAGGHTLSGTVTESCAEFTVVSGAAYSLAAGQSQTVTVRFQAAATGPYSCTLDTGGACADVACVAVVELAPSCSVDPTTLAFGTVPPNTPVQLAFTITNTGGGTLSGTVVESCAEFSILSGAAYNLASGQSQTVTVQFQGAAGGTFACVLDTGGSCSDVSCTGTVEPPPACEISLPVLDFGLVLPGTPVVSGFQITNIGGGTLSGTVSEACEPFTVVSGGTYNLGAGQSQVVMMQFLATAPGTYACVVDPGAGCDELQVTGSTLSLQLATGPQSACGAVDELGHLPGSTTGFVPDWDEGLVGLDTNNDGSLIVVVSIFVNDQQVWSGPVTGTSWRAADAEDFDLADWFDQDVELHFEATDGTTVWNDGGGICSWDLSFLTLAAPAMPQAFLLHEPMPNPFNPATRLQLDLPEPDHARLAVVDLRGRTVEVLADRDFPAGRHELVWQPRNLASGTYFVTVACRQGTQVRKVLFLK